MCIIYTIMALEFDVLSKVCHARAGNLKLPHGNVRTPVFMPVGTKGTIKALSTEQLQDEALAPEIILGNTYHLALQPGTELLADLGGLHKFMNWSSNLLTDSGKCNFLMGSLLRCPTGGFQMVSLLDLAEVLLFLIYVECICDSFNAIPNCILQITEEGVKFKSPVDGTEMLLTPEESIKCQVQHITSRSRIARLLLAVLHVVFIAMQFSRPAYSLSTN